jgi:hypothetical protein
MVVQNQDLLAIRPGCWRNGAMRSAGGHDFSFLFVDGAGDLSSFAWSGINLQSRADEVGSIFHGAQSQTGAL